MVRILTASVYLLFVCSLSILGHEDVMAYEEAKYEVILNDGDFELRQYKPQIVAETIVEGDFDAVGNEAFRRLFNYISGKNHKKQSIPMTAPVSQETTSEKIAMTTPVNQEKVGDSWRITFLMPSEYTMDTLPGPLDPRVVLREVPGRLMAAHSYSGTWSKGRFERKRAELEEWIKQRKLRIIGETVFARYNPPFTPWFMRRNEVVIPVGQTEK